MITRKELEINAKRLSGSFLMDMDKNLTLKRKNK